MTALHPNTYRAGKFFSLPSTSEAHWKAILTAPISYGVNGNAKVVGVLDGQVKKSSVFILFAPAQAAGATVAFPGTSDRGGDGRSRTRSLSGGVQNNRTRINALFADLHAESLTWDDIQPRCGHARRSGCGLSMGSRSALADRHEISCSSRRAATLRGPDRRGLAARDWSSRQAPFSWPPLCGGDG